MQNNALMAKKRSTGMNEDRHKPSRMVRLRERLAAELDKVADVKATSITELVNQAVREYLEREGLWPPKPG